MKKYDCSKTIDFSHETARMCHGFKYCEDGCPLRSLDHPCGLAYTTQETIDVVQRWSDDHPEPPKLTREEHDFLASFMYPEELSIRKGGFTMQLDTHYKKGYQDATIPLRKDMFHFIEDDKVWTVEELLKLEVEE